MKVKVLTTVAVSAVFLVAGCGGSDAPESPVSDEPEKLDPQAVIEATAPATAMVLGESFGNEGGGSGVVFDAEQGLILTNAHVAEGLDKLRVSLGEESTSYPARLRAVAPCDDLAVIEMVQKPADLTELTISDREVERGEHVTALGFPGNLQNFGEQTLQTTDGTVSNPDVVGHEISPELPTYQALTQHTAPINPGNSGGPLVDDFGEVVGINTLGSTDAQGQLYAIDSAYIQQLLPSLVAGEDRLRMGWNLVPYQTIDLASEFEYYIGDVLAQSGFTSADAAKFVQRQIGASDGLYVYTSEPGLPGDKATIYEGDLITSIDDEPVNSVSDVCEILQSQESGATVSISGNIVASSSDLDNIGQKFTVQMELPQEEFSSTGTTDTTTETTGG